MDDLISRASFRSNIQTVLNDTTCPIHIAAEIEQYMELEPAVDAVPVVHARWIPHKTPSGRETIFERCSACKQPTLVTRETPYCPWCGAKMDSGRRDDDGASR